MSDRACPVIPNGRSSTATSSTTNTSGRMRPRASSIQNGTTKAEAVKGEVLAPSSRSRSGSTLRERSSSVRGAGSPPLPIEVVFISGSVTGSSSSPQGPLRSPLHVGSSSRGLYKAASPTAQSKSVESTLNRHVRGHRRTDSLYHGGVAAILPKNDSAPSNGEKTSPLHGEPASDLIETKKREAPSSVTVTSVSQGPLRAPRVDERYEVVVKGEMVLYLEKDKEAYREIEMAQARLKGYHREVERFDLEPMRRELRRGNFSAYCETLLVGDQRSMTLDKMREEDLITYRYIRGCMPSFEQLARRSEGLEEIYHRILEGKTASDQAQIKEYTLRDLERVCDSALYTAILSWIDPHLWERYVPKLGVVRRFHFAAYQEELRQISLYDLQRRDPDMYDAIMKRLPPIGELAGRVPILEQICAAFPAGERRARCESWTLFHLEGIYSSQGQEKTYQSIIGAIPFSVWGADLVYGLSEIRQRSFPLYILLVSGLMLGEFRKQDPQFADYVIQELPSLGELIRRTPVVEREWLAILEPLGLDKEALSLLTLRGLRLECQRQRKLLLYEQFLATMDSSMWGYLVTDLPKLQTTDFSLYIECMQNISLAELSEYDLELYETITKRWAIRDLLQEEGIEGVREELSRAEARGIQTLGDLEERYIQEDKPGSYDALCSQIGFFVWSHRLPSRK